MHFHLPKPLHGWREFAGEVQADHELQPRFRFDRLVACAVPTFRSLEPNKEAFDVPVVQQLCRPAVKK